MTGLLLLFSVRNSGQIGFNITIDWFSTTVCLTCEGCNLDWIKLAEETELQPDVIFG